MSSTKMGPFELEGVIGRGGMGTVYRARHEDTQEVVAIKALSATFSENPHFRSRFESEIKALIQLDHPNIVRLISHGQEDGNLYFAMELVEGQSLFELQKKTGKADWRDVLNVARDVATGLRHAHDRGIIHRDLKPGNLLRSNEGVYKITDFGIAKRFGNDQNTQDNVLGTLAFMSPEQAKGEPVTVRSDLFSLGIVLYTMLSGKPPFAGSSMEESLRNLTKVPAPRLGVLVPGLPVEIEELIGNLIEKKPENRIPTAQVLLHRIGTVENTLKDYSQAATKHGIPEEPSHKTVSSFPTDANIKQTEAGLFQPEPKPNAAAATGTNAERTKNLLGGNDTAGREKAAKKSSDAAIEKADYYNPVTEEDRRQSFESDTYETNKSGLGILPLSIAMIVVLGLAGWGLYNALKPMTANGLYDVIVEKAERPNKVKEEIAEFLQRFPDDERYGEIERLEKVATAIAYFNTKSMAFANSGETRLTPMEQDFVKTINLAKEDSVDGFSRLRAFITVHAASGDKSERAVACLRAAKGYMTKLRIDADNAVVWHQDSIDEAFRRAEDSSNGEKIKIFQAIIELYGEANWAEASVAKAKERLKLLN